LDEIRRLLYVGMTRAKDLLIFAHRRGKTAWLDQLEAFPALLPVDPPEWWPEDSNRADGVEVELQGISTNALLRSLVVPELTDEEDVDAPVSHWVAGTSRSTVAVVDRYANPSEQPRADDWEAAEVLSLPGAAPAGGSKKTESLRREIGNAVHDYLAALPSLSRLGDELKLGVAWRCIEGRSMEGGIDKSEVVAAGDALVQWVESRYPGASWLTESPVTSPREDGSQWRGAIDLVLHLGDNRLVVIDHKSTRLDEAGAGPAALQHAGQIAAYCEAVETQGFTVEAGWVHFPLAGMVVRLARQ